MFSYNFVSKNIKQIKTCNLWKSHCENKHKYRLKSVEKKNYKPIP